MKLDSDKAILDRVIEKEGFDYAMTEYSNYNGTVPFNHIHDEKFHELLKEFKLARAKLVAHCQRNTSIEFG